MFNAYFFDLDGTLVDTIDDLATAANSTRISQALPELPLAIVKSYIGDGIKTLIHRLLTEKRDGIAPDAQFTAAYQYFVRYYSDHLYEYSQPYENVRETLATLHKQGKKLAVITNKNEDLAVRLLKYLQLADYFSLIYGGDTFALRKPNAYPLKKALEVLQLSQEETLMVGDSINDVLSAHAAGMKAAFYTNGFGTDIAADFVFSDYAELLKLH